MLNPVTVDQWIAFLYENGRRRTTRRDYRAHAVRFLRWLNGRALSPTILLEYRDYLQTEKDPPLRPRSINANFTALKSFLTWLQETRPAAVAELPHFPDLSRVPKVKVDQARRNIPEDEHISAMLQAARRMPTGTLSKRYLRARAVAILETFCHTGLRRRELLDLNTGDIRREGERWILYIRSGKGGKPENMEINPAALAAIQAYLPVRAEWAAAHGCSSAALWLVDKSRRLSDRGLTELFRNLCELAGLDARQYTPHCLRHWFGTAVMQVSDPKTAQALLRHANFATTAEIYLHSSEKRQREALDGIAAKLSPPAANLPADPPPARESTRPPAAPSRRDESPAPVRSARLQRAAGFTRRNVGR